MSRSVRKRLAAPNLMARLGSLQRNPGNKPLIDLIHGGMTTRAIEKKRVLENTPNLKALYEWLDSRDAR